MKSRQTGSIPSINSKKKNSFPGVALITFGVLFGTEGGFSTSLLLPVFSKGFVLVLLFEIAVESLNFFSGSQKENSFEG